MINLVEVCNVQVYFVLQKKFYRQVYWSYRDTLFSHSWYIMIMRIILLSIKLSHVHCKLMTGIRKSYQRTMYPG